MKKSIILMLGLVLALASCTNKSFKLSGETDKEVQYVYYTLNYFDEEPKMDSVAVVDGKYVIEGMADSVVLATGVTDQNLQFWFVAEPGEITISQDGLPSGTPQNDAIKSLLEKAAKVTSQEDVKKVLYDFIELHNNDYAGALCLYLCTDILGLSETGKLLESCGDVIKSTIYKVMPKEMFDKADATSEGKPFVDFEVEYDGVTQKLSNYVGQGKYVLVDFWASWCGPCREEIPTIIELNNKYAGENFQVLGVATWDKPEDTMAAMEELGIKYDQIINAQAIGSDAYNIQGIPEIILFSPDGTILRRGLRGEDMVKAVEEVLGA